MTKQKKYNIKNEKIFNIDFHLQWFGAEDEGRTEDPTGKKKQKARGEGQIAKSQDIPQAFVLLFAFIFLSIYGKHMIRHIQNFMIDIFSGGWAKHTVDIDFIYLILINVIIVLTKTVGPVFLVIIIVALASNFAQVGFLFTTKPLKPDFKKILPTPKKIIEKLLFSKQVAYNLIKSLLKLVFIGFFAVSVLVKNYDKLLNTVRLEFTASVSFIWSVIFEIGWKTSILLIILSLLDYWWNYREHIEKLKMTKHEVKDEHKQIEGDPQIKSKIREKQRLISQRRMMQDVPKADVVITNPTHLSIAIMYDKTVSEAPVVIAKGEGFLALKIRELAAEAGVPLYEDKPLARALFESVEIGETIPVQLYKSVAEVLSFVYKLKGKRVFS
jgi:flagellar biosynthesis protein FlhB